MKRARFLACRLDHYDLHYKLQIPRRNNAHRLDDSEKHALTEEHACRQETMEGFGYARSEPTTDEQKRRETDQLIELMSSRWLQIHSEYIMQGSGSYNDYQREAVAREMQRRPTAVMIPAGVHLDEDEEMMDD
ncbi:hypothetical protein VN97_g11964 [Penicillium thymicola]|uniref:Uncharacterized protein n=1 Tax=Penicillium thymicola TaxID=293382 RepID=A0AAI9X2P4_PENTH|nr:hypothetical protein VN97_g11964 [Penicillium thymicola]